jgi:VanZ family protein
VSLRSALREFRHPGWWLGIWYFGWVACVLLSLMPPPDLGVSVPEGDKFGHVFAYALLAAWACWIFADARAHWRAAWALVGLGLAMELAQGAFTSDRMMDGWDLLADAAGVFAGAWLARRHPALLQRLETRLRGRR